MSVYVKTSLAPPAGSVNSDDDQELIRVRLRRFPNLTDDQINLLAEILDPVLVEEIGDNWLASLVAGTLPGLPLNPDGGLALGLPGATASCRWVGATVSGAPVTGAFLVGDFVVTHDGHVFVCIEAGAPGTWVDQSLVEALAAAPDATVSTKGLVQLGGDLGGTATAPTVPGLAGKADASATTTALAGKADATATTSALAGKVAKPGSGLNGKVTKWNNSTGALEDGSSAVTALVGGSFAPLDSPPLTGTPTVNGAQIEDRTHAAAAVAVATTNRAANPRMATALFAPTVTVTSLVDTIAADEGFTWVANPSVAFFDGLFYVVFDGNKAASAGEGSTGQAIWCKTSADGVTWGTAFLPFTDAAKCNNPVTDTGIAFQPNLAVVGSVLWASWSYGSVAYLSKLTASSGKWTNARFEFIGRQPYLTSTVNGAATSGKTLAASFDGITDWAPFPATIPTVLSDGTVAVPLTFQSTSIDPLSPGTASSFFRTMKSNVIFYTSDSGATWYSSEPIRHSTVGFPAAEWEPTVSEAADGDLYVWSRNNRTALPNSDTLLVSVSRNRINFSPAVASDLYVPVARPSVGKVSPQRWLLATNDFPHNDTATPESFSSSNRLNATLFVSRRGTDDYLPGIGISGATANQTYPQCIVHGGKVYTVFTEDNGVSGGSARSLRLSTTSSAPTDDTVAYVHPRRYSEFTGGGPQLVAGSPSYYRFAGLQQATAAAALSAPTDFAASAWFSSGVSSPVVVDTRSTANTAPLLRTTGLSMGSMSLTHGVSVPFNAPMFLAVSFTSSTGLVRFYVGTGGGTITTVDTYFKSFLIGTPANNETIVVNGTTLTFKTSASAGTDVQIGADTFGTSVNLAAALVANGFLASTGNTAGVTNRVYVARSTQATFTATGSAGCVLDTATPVAGGPPRVGAKALSTSSATGFTGAVYDVSVFTSTLTAANAVSLHNAFATSLGLSAAGGTSTSPGTPAVHFDAAANTTNFPDLTLVPGAATVVSDGTLGRNVLRLTGEASAAVELPYDVTTVSIPFKLDQVPSGSDKYVIATLGSASAPVRVYIDGAHAGKLMVDGTAAPVGVTDPTRYNTVEVTIGRGRMSVAGLTRKVTGPARLYLGSAFPESLLASGRTTTFDVLGGGVADGRLAEPSPLRGDNVETISGSWNFTGTPTKNGNQLVDTSDQRFAGYRRLALGYARLDAATATTTGIHETGTGSAAGANGGLNAFYLDPADWPTTALLRVRMSILTNDVAPTSIFTAVLVPTNAPSGAAATVAATFGATVSGSSAVISTPAADSAVVAVSTNFAPVTAGMYALGLVIGSNMAASSSAVVRITLDVKF